MDAKTTTIENTHFYFLDFLKFILAVIIVFHHFQQHLSVKFENFNFYYGRIYFGHIVEFFFIISGILMTLFVEKSIRRIFIKK